MAKNSSYLEFAGDGEIYVAPLATPLPVTPTETLNAAFSGLGWMADDGVAISSEIDTTKVGAWQSQTPIANRTNTRSTQVQGGFLEVKQLTFEAFFGGGSWATTAGPPAYYTYTPPTGSGVYERAMVVEALDGADVTRFTFAKVSIAETGEVNLRNADAANLVITFEALATTSGLPFSFISSKTKYSAA